MAPLVLEHILIPHVEETIDDYEVLRVPTYQVDDRVSWSPHLWHSQA